MRPEPIWVRPAAVRQIHRDQIEQFGGRDGVRDVGMLDSALDRPLNLHHYETPTLPELAASYAFGIAMNHPFIDGNKRTAFVVSALFLEINGLAVAATEADAAATFLALAAGELSEAALAAWFEERTEALPA